VEKAFDDFPALGLSEAVAVGVAGHQSGKHFFKGSPEAVEAERMRVVGVLLIVGEGSHDMCDFSLGIDRAVVACGYVLTFLLVGTILSVECVMLRPRLVLYKLEPMCRNST